MKDKEYHLIEAFFYYENEMGCTALKIDEETRQAIQDGKLGKYKGIHEGETYMTNYYPLLKDGDILPIELKEGYRRPVIDSQYLYDNFMLTGTYYYFDCLDGILGERLLTAQQINDEIVPLKELSDKEIIKVAADYEATLFKFTYDHNKTIDDYITRNLLYDPWDIFN